jgi:Cysteine rich repeat
MAQQRSSSSIVAGAITILGLGLVWVTVAVNFPSQEELSSAAVPTEIRQAARSSSPVAAPPILDLTIPRSSPFPSETSAPKREDSRSRDFPLGAPAVTKLNPRAVQVAKLRCDAEIERLCSGSQDGSGRTRCLEQRAKQLSLPCQSQVRERFVKWKENRSRMMTACDEDAKRFCDAVKPGGGQILQCLQSHTPEVSERCYKTLPKGTLYVQ